jgi:hypothetical protein
VQGRHTGTDQRRRRMAEDPVDDCWDGPVTGRSAAFDPPDAQVSGRPQSDPGAPDDAAALTGRPNGIKDASRSARDASSWRPRCGRVTQWAERVPGAWSRWWPCC